MNIGDNTQKSLLFQEFERNFKRYKNTPIALYGLGINTKYLLESLDDYNIVGIMANEHIGDTVFGKKVLSTEEAVSLVKIIVIIAWPRSVKIIYNRIKDLEQKGIKIYNINGQRLKDLFSASEPKVFQNQYWSNSEGDLKKQIDTHEYISFDIFDTIITRNILTPQKLFDVIERELKEDRIADFAFKYERMYAEKTLNDTGLCPDLSGIYSVIKENCRFSDDLINKIMDREIEVERRYITPRYKMVEIMRYAYLKGKKVYLISDMYLNKKIIKEILAGLDITCYTDILVSCDIRRTKSSGELFDYYLQITGKSSCLHIGDNINSDIKAAKKKGINTFYIMSGYDMLLNSTCESLVTNASSIEDYTMLGIFAAKAFNSPFSLNKTNGRLPISTLEELGFYCFSPLTLKYISHLINTVKGKGDSVILFGSRDGYFIEKLYSRIVLKNFIPDMPKGLYFYTSRRAVSVASIKIKEDIIKITDSLKNISKGSVSSNLKARLGINFDKKNPVLNMPLACGAYEKNRVRILECILKYQDKIIRRASFERKNYFKYIKNLNLNKFSNVYFFDLATQGTIFTGLKKIVKKPMHLLCFGIKNVPNEYIKDTSNTDAIFEKMSSVSGNNFGKKYPFFEVVYSSDESQLKCFDKNGNCKFESQRYSNQIKRVQTGILEYFDLFERLDKHYYKRSYSLDLSDMFLALTNANLSLASKKIAPAFKFKDGFRQEDFCNLWEELI